MSKFYETDKFKQLHKKWQQKLKESGFEDQEESTPIPDVHRLKRWSSSFFKGRINQTQYEARIAYYRFTGQFLNEYKFANKNERDIWELHSSGMGYRKIALKLDLKSYKVRDLITKLAKQMWKKRKADNESGQE